MQMLVIPGLLALIGVSFAVGVKLIVLARRTGGFPEWALGLFFLLGAGLGYPLSALAPMSGEWQGIVAAASSVVMSAGMFLLYAFTARVFYAGRVAGKIGLALGGALCLAYVLGYSITQIAADSAEELLASVMTWGGLSLVMSAGAFAWSSYAALSEWSLHRKRLALGLADPVVTNRLLLWGLMGITIIAIVVIDTAALYSGSDFARLTIIPLATSAGGLLYGAFLALAFFPPASYVAALRRRHGSAPGDA
jgi:hypothetical protein